MYIQYIPYRGIGSKRTYKLRILCKYIIITICCQLFFILQMQVFPCFPAAHASLSNIHESVVISNCLLQKISGDASASPDTMLSCLIFIHTKITLHVHSFCLRNQPLCHSSSTSAASPSPPGLAVLGWNLYMHQVSHLLRSQEVSQGIHSPGQIPARMDSCQIHNS